MYTTTKPFSPYSSPASSPTLAVDSSPALSPEDDFVLDIPEPPPFSLVHPFAASAKANRAPPEYEKPLTPPRSPSSNIPAKRARYAHWQSDSTPCLPVSPPESTYVSCTPVAENAGQAEAAIWDDASTRVVDNAYGTIELEARNLTHIPHDFISDISNVFIPPENPEYASSSAEFFPVRVTSVPAANMTSRTRSFKRTRSTVGRDPKDIQLYLSSNRIANIPLELLTLQNLTLLSIRQNHLTYIPPEITSLRNLRDLNIAANRLEYLPAEILNMSLTQLQVFPNPFLEPPSAVMTDAPRPISSTKRYLPKIIPLVEMAFRVLLSPSSTSPRECVLDQYYDLPLDECSSDSTSRFNVTSGKWQFPFPIPLHLRAILSTCVPYSVDPGELTPTSLDDPWFNVTGIGHCPSPRHSVHRRGQYGQGVFVRHAEERYTWESVIAGIRVGGPVPLRWRGCQWGCLDYLDGKGDGSELLETDSDQAAGVSGFCENEEMEDIVQVIQLSGAGGLDEFDSD